MHFLNAPIPDSERERLEALRSYHILDTEPEPEFDEITALASRILAAPVSLISLVDRHRQWFKSVVGLPFRETPRDSAFCAHTILENRVLVVRDTYFDDRFRTNPLVRSEPFFRSYTGIPLINPEGFALGTLSVFDYIPKEMTEHQIEILRVLANQVMARLELRRLRWLLEESRSDRSRMETALHQSSSLFHSVMEGTSDAIFAKDLQGKYLFINSTGAAFLNREPEEVIGKDDRDLFSPDTVASILKHDRQVLDSGETITYEGVGTVGDITRVFLATKGPLRDENGKVIGLVGVSRDITQSKKAEEALRQSEMRYRELFEHVLDGVYQSTPDGRLLTANPALVQMLGFETEEEFLSTDISSLYVNPLERRKWTTYLAEHEYVHNAELVLRRKDGTEIVVLENARAVRDLMGNVQYYEGTLTDITERKKIEQTKDELVSIVAHELRSPLTSIRGSLDYINSIYSEDLPPQVQKMIDLASRGTERLVRLINNMLDIDRIESGKMKWSPESFPIRTLLEQAVEMNEMYGKEYSVQFRIREPLPDARVCVDPDAFAQVLTNLLSNAARFSPTGVDVSISAQIHDSMVRILVTDHGPGIPENFRSRIFGKFTQADSQKEGSGLGLSICKTIVERMGGRIAFETELNQGTTFYFDLPLA